MSKIKNTQFTIMLVITVLLVGMLLQNYKEIVVLKEKLTEAEKSYPPIYDVLDTVSYPNFEYFLDERGEEDTYVYIGRPTCSDCVLFEPQLIEMITNEGMGDIIKYLNVASIRENEDEWAYFKDKYQILYTPTLARFRNGNLVSKVEWTPDRDLSIDMVCSWISSNLKR